MYVVMRNDVMIRAFHNRDDADDHVWEMEKMELALLDRRDAIAPLILQAEMGPERDEKIRDLCSGMAMKVGMTAREFFLTFSPQQYDVQTID